ncbi:hypothetical protein [Streptomyces sp. NPDC001889]
MPSRSPDFRLDGYEAVNPRIHEAFWQHIGVDEEDFTELAGHHTEDGRHSYYLLHDGTLAGGGLPGEPQIVALCIRRDPDARDFDFQHKRVPLPAMAQSWLIARGCSRDGIRVPPGTGTAAADDATRALEERLRGDGERFAFLTAYTNDTSDTPEITVLLGAADAKELRPFRVLLRRVDPTSRTHTLREGGFRTVQGATDWWDAHWRGETPALPPLPGTVKRADASVVSPPSTPPRGRTR